MPQRRGGGGGGGGDGGTDSILRQGLRELLNKVDRAAATNGSGEVRGRGTNVDDGRRGRGVPQRGSSSSGTGPANLGRATGANRPPQIGDWPCRSCGFLANFARRKDCFQCRRPRSPRAGNGGATSGGGAPSLSRGPVGAGGLRPLLGGRGANGGGGGGASRAVDNPPTHRVPGASAAARASAATAGGTWADVAKRTLGAGGATSPPLATEGTGRHRAGMDDGGNMVDDEGFQTVTRRSGRRANAAASGGGDATDGRASASDAPAHEAAGHADGDDGGEPAEDDSPPTVADLQRAWQEEVALVKRLRQQGLAGDHPAMVAACEARDAAERTWRGSKEPAPASVRLGRAQAKLDRSIELQAEARQALLDAEHEHKVRMEGLQATMDECSERVKTRRRQLREVQEEVGAGGNCGARDAQQRAIMRVHGTICEEVGPTIAALVEQLDSATPAWAALNGLLAKLSTSKDILEEACPSQPAAQTFDIGDGGDRWEGWSQWSESHDLRGPAEADGGDGRETSDQQEQWQQGHGWQEAQSQYSPHDQPMDTSEWWDAPPRRWQGATRWQASGHGQWARASWADQMEEDDGESGDDTNPPPPARRRLEPVGAASAGDGGQQLSQPTQLQRQQLPAGGPAAADATQADPESQKRMHAERVNRIVTMAIDAGINPLTPQGEELQFLDPQQLEAWVAEHFPAALLR